MIHWLVQSLDEVPEIATGNAPAELLDEQEIAVLRTLKVEKRRRDWLLGRWTAKHLVQSYVADKSGIILPLPALRIVAAEDGSPYCIATEATERLDGRLPITLSISHSNGVAFCALCQEQIEAQERGNSHPIRLSLGCDIEHIERREANFVGDFFTAQEMRDVMGTPVEQRDCRVTAIWSGKEAVLKSLRTGLRIDTRRIHCRFSGEELAPAEWTHFDTLLDDDLANQYPGGWSAWWRVHRDFVLTMALREQ